MTELTDEAVKAMLDGATPGPWDACGEVWSRKIYSSGENRVCFMAHSNGLDDDRDIATSELVAAAPDLARALLDARAELTSVKADAERAVEAVRQMHHAVCGETGFAAAIRAVTGLPYPWPALDLAEEIAIEVMRKDMP